MVNRGLTEEERGIYRRNILLPEIGEEGQAKLLESRVLVVGLGGLGSSALYYLAACGVGEIGLADGDAVDPSNLQRQILHGWKDVGKSKIASARESVERLRANARLVEHPSGVTVENAEDVIGYYDFVVEATDNFASKFLVNDVCVRLGKAFSHAGASGVHGQAMTVVPGEGPCFRCVFGDACESTGARADEGAGAGVLGTVPGLMGLVQATEAIKYLLGLGGLLLGRMLSWDAIAMTFREARLPVRGRCALCSARMDGMRKYALL